MIKRKRERDKNHGNYIFIFFYEVPPASLYCLASFMNQRKRRGFKTEKINGLSK